MTYSDPNEKRRPIFPVEIDGVQVTEALADTGSERTIIGGDVIDKINANRSELKLSKKAMKVSDERIYGIHGDGRQVQSYCAASLIKWNEFELYERVVIIPSMKGLILNSSFSEAADAYFTWCARSVHPRVKGRFLSNELEGDKPVPVITTKLNTCSEVKLVSLGANEIAVVD